MKILITFYTMHGHTYELAKAQAEGAKEIEGAEVMVRKVAEFPEVDAIIDGNEAARSVREATSDIPVVTLDDIRQADGLIFGTPTRFGNMCAQMKKLFDSMTELWLNGEIEGKPAGVFVSTASTHGGQETTLLTMYVPLLHLGALIVGVPYSVPGMIHSEGRGGTPYGASTIAGHAGELKPTPEDIAIARAQGRRIAEITMKLK